MHCAPRRTNSDIQKNSDRGRDLLSRKEQKSLRKYFEDCEVPSATWRNSDRRCPILTFFSLKPHGHWGTVALPSQCPAYINHLVADALGNMDSLHVVYPPPIYPFKINRQRVQKGPPPDVTYSVKSFTSRRFSGSAVRHQARNKTLASKATKWNGVPKEPFQKSLNCSDSSSTIPNDSTAINSTNMSIGQRKIDNIAKRSSRKKSRKKGKQSKKSSCNTGSNEPEVLSEESVNGSSASETCGNNGGDRQSTASTAPDILFPETGAKNSEFPKACTASSDEVGVPSLSNFENRLLLKNSGFPIFNRVEGIPRPVSCYSDMYSKGYSDLHDSFVLGSTSVGSNSDDSSNAGHDDKSSEKGICKIDISEKPGLSSRKGYFSRQSLLNDVADTFDHSEEIRHDIVPNKRSKQNKVAPRSGNVSKFGSIGNYIRAGKENNHSVWKKVQRNDSNACSGELKKASSVYSSFDLPLREASFLNRTCNSADINSFAKGEDKKQQKDKVLKKLKRKTGPALKQELNCYSRKDSHGSMAGLDGCLKSSIEHNDIAAILCQEKAKEGLNLVSRSCSPPHCPRDGSECMTSESVHSMRFCPNEMDHLESVCNTASGLNTQSVGTEKSSMQSPVYLPHLLCNAASQEVQKETDLVESSRKNPSSSGSFTHKWMPIGLKNPRFLNSTRSGSSSLEHSDESASKRWTLKETVKGNLVSDTQNLASKVVMCMNQHSGDSTYPSNGFEERLPRSSTAEEVMNNKLGPVNGINCSEVSEDLNTFEADSNRILEAVNNACRAQLASEAVQIATGCPIAEFERLLYYSSPVIHHAPDFINCHSCCSRNQVDRVGGVPLCRHETPNITLGCLWQWYEKYGSYGLKIKAEEFGNSKRLGADRFAFLAYFVPYLSGIQLFTNGNTDSVDINSSLLKSDALNACGNSETSKDSSTIDSLALFSVVFPQQGHEEDAVTPPLVSRSGISEQSSSSAKDVSVRLTGTRGSNDLELLYEYFESEQPQERRPLYDKIKDLVRGDGLSHLKTYGDPTKLDSIHLNDLHPRSWYSVAWYPIYRIPDGNFRAAFLTYHSLGHLVRRSANFESRNMDACIVSPVVGLQSYNAKSECWFQLTPSTLKQTTVTPELNAYGVLEKRLRTLEETASLMARAVVNKGSSTSVNRHPDYEFFLSRRRW